MSRRIWLYINECSTCQTSKPSNEPETGPLYPILVDDPFHTVAVDFVTGLPRSYDEFDALLTATEKFTKAIRLIPCMTTTTAEETAKLDIKHVMPILSLPEKIISDRDPHFTSVFWQELVRLLEIKLGMTGAFHPAADGQSEKTNQIVEIALRCFVAGDEERYSKWTDWLRVSEHEYNNTPLRLQSAEHLGSLQSFSAR